MNMGKTDQPESGSLDAVQQAGGVEIDKDALGVLLTTNYNLNGAVSADLAMSSWAKAQQDQGVDLDSLYRLEKKTPIQAIARMIQYRAALAGGQSWTPVFGSCKMGREGGRYRVQLDHKLVGQYTERAVTREIGFLEFIQEPDAAGASFTLSIESGADGDISPEQEASLRRWFQYYRDHFVPSDFTNVVKVVGAQRWATPWREKGGVYFWPQPALREAAAVTQFIREALSHRRAIKILNVSGRGAGAKEHREAVMGSIEDDISRSHAKLAAELQQFAEEMGADKNHRVATFEGRLRTIGGLFDKASVYEKLLNCELSDHRQKLASMKEAFAAFKILAGI
jgi:hypothetical protein